MAVRSVGAKDQVLDVTYGYSRTPGLAKQLADVLRSAGVEGSLYIGYPVFATAEDQVTVDALLVSTKHGLVIVKLVEDAPDQGDSASWQTIKDDLDRLYLAVEASLSRYEELRSGRSLAVEPQTVAVFPTLDGAPRVAEAYFADLKGLPQTLERFAPLDDRYYRPLQAALQRISTIKPRKRRQRATTPASRGSVLKAIEKEIANLDRAQKQAAIESPEGPQRIRGLAGTGKTIVLALKAAYLHARHPEWVIAVTFQTRSLYQQFTDLIRRFSFEQINDEPDWQNLRILHAWGGGGREGVYSQIAQHMAIDARDYLYGRERFGREQAFDGVCSELLAAARTSSSEPIYDAVLIDEAQDLPSAFFQLIHRFTREPKRIVWAYDDLQRLSETSMPSLEELFGKDESGDPIVALANNEGAQQDVVLRVCYRNPPWTLVTAHALGLGIYRTEGLVQHFDDPGLWTEVGYGVRHGTLAPGSRVSLYRSSDSYPEYFPTLLKADDVIVHKVFTSEVDQAEWIAGQIQSNLRSDELEMDDILVVLPSARTARSNAQPIATALARRGINSHLAGVTSSLDEIFKPESVALAHIHRSKGNEAAMVYVANAHQCLAGYGLVTLRNTLFTAVTRSRAWVRICGVGQPMEALASEINKLTQANYELRFKVPTAEELAKMRQIHRELSANERQRLQAAEKSLRALRDAVDRGELDIEQLPLDIRTFLARLASRGPDSSDDDE
jgi:superfamily I DNA and RNA helicase